MADKKVTSDLLGEIFQSIKNFFITLGKPTLKRRYVYDGSPPCSDDINKTFTEIYNDIHLAADEQIMIGEAFRESFNYTTTEQKRLRNRIKKVGELINDYVVTAKNTIHHNLVIQDSFTNSDKAELDHVGNPVNLDTKNGLVTLGISGNINHSPSARVLDITTNQPYSMPGNFMVAYKVEEQASQSLFLEGKETTKEQWDLLFNIDPHSNVRDILDGKANTWYEHQMINVKEEYKKPGYKGQFPDTKGYGWTWADGTPIYYGSRDDSLELTITIELPEVSVINWIDFYPYFPNEDSYLIINEVATSVNNAGDYVSCLMDSGNRNVYLGSGSSTLPIDVKDRQKFRGHGTWLFNARPAKYVKLKMTAEKPYDCNIAHLYFEVYYEKKTTKRVLFFKKSKTTKHKKRVDTIKFDRDKVMGFTGDRDLIGEFADVGSSIAGGLGSIIGGILGAAVSLFYSEKVEIKNEELTSGFDIYPAEGGHGWRWCIGIRGIDINSYTYEPKGTFMSKTFQLNKPAKEISLSVSEFIPEEFYGDNQKTKNTWIRYYISVDDGNTWYPISPLERSPVYSEKNFPPKIISIVEDENDQQLGNKTYIVSDKEVRTVKLMAELSRPEEYETLTPIIYDYQIRIVPKAGGDD